MDRKCSDSRGSISKNKFYGALLCLVIIDWFVFGVSYEWDVRLGICGFGAVLVFDWLLDIWPTIRDGEASMISSVWRRAFPLVLFVELAALVALLLLSYQTVLDVADGYLAESFSFSIPWFDLLNMILFGGALWHVALIYKKHIPAASSFLVQVAIWISTMKFLEVWTGLDLHSADGTSFAMERLNQSALWLAVTMAASLFGWWLVGLCRRKGIEVNGR